MASNTTWPMPQRKQFTTAPAIFDLIAAKLADRTYAPAGAEAHLTGSVTHLDRPPRALRQGLA